MDTIDPAILLGGGFLGLCVLGVVLMLLLQKPRALPAQLSAPLWAQAGPRPGERGRQILQLWNELGQDQVGFDIEHQWARAAAAHHSAPFFASMQAMQSPPAPTSPGAPAPKPPSA